MNTTIPTDTQLIRLVGVYDADGTIWGELSYWVGARLGRQHCSLCDITHGSVRPKDEWRAYRERLSAGGVRFETYHRDDQPDEARAASNSLAPVVVAETTAGWQTILTAEDLEGCHGSVAELQGALQNALAEAGLNTPVEVGLTPVEVGLDSLV